MLLSREYPPDTAWGGIGTYTFNLAHGLARHGHWVDVVSLSLTGRIESTSAAGVSVHRLPGRADPTAGHVRVAYDMLARAHDVSRWIRRHVSESGVDVIECPDWWAEGLACRVRPPGAALVVRVHGYVKLIARLHRWPRTSGLRLREMAEGAALGGADMVLPNTRWIAGQLARDHDVSATNMRVLSMGVDTALFRPQESPRLRCELRERLGLHEGARVVLSCGRLEPRKGFDHLIRALSILMREIRDVYLVIAGQHCGQLEVLQSVAQATGVSERVRFAGPIPYSELPGWYALSDLYAGASRGESPGLTYLEAMACGRPVVALRDGGTPEVVKHGQTGLLVDSEEPLELAGALSALLSDPDLRERMGTAGVHHVAETLSMDVTIPRHVALYREARAGL